jgi:hypothetical protein
MTKTGHEPGVSVNFTNILQPNCELNVSALKKSISEIPFYLPLNKSRVNNVTFQDTSGRAAATLTLSGGQVIGGR